ncbi:MAG: hypothetical protein EXR69_02790 [Myxococcales bacterium]|nr:hypothetical protein [Myxococcales bacterium]
MRSARTVGQPLLLIPALVLALVPGCAFRGPGQDSSAPRDCETRSAFYRDADGDTYGDTLNVVVGCSAEDGYVERGGDCDDARAEVSTICWSADTGPADTGPADTAAPPVGPC